MQFEGILHNYVFTKNRPWDVKMYAITRSHTSSSLDLFDLKL
jgi:ribosomal-protein-alanine N-acetyltransferase